MTALEVVARLGTAAVLLMILVLVYADEIEDTIRRFIDFIMGKY